jgi:hypothetical protein
VVKWRSLGCTNCRYNKEHTECTSSRVKILFSPNFGASNIMLLIESFAKFFNDCHYRHHPTFVGISFWQCGLYLVSTVNL